jgi:hypothetical protein
MRRPLVLVTLLIGAVIVAATTGGAAYPERP